VLCVCYVELVGKGGAEQTYRFVQLFKQRLSAEQNTTYCSFMLTAANGLNCCKKEMETKDVGITSSVLFSYFEGRLLV
jgi:hypothetical protein